VQAISLSAGTVKLWACDSIATPDKLYSFTDNLLTTATTLTSPADGMAISVNPVSGKSFDVTFTWERPSSKAAKYDVWVAFDSDFSEVVNKSTAYDPAGDPSTVSLVVGPSGNTGPPDTLLEFMPGTTYYWKVRVSQAGPIYSPWSEVRSFTIGSLEEKVPGLLSPANGATGVSLTPAFSWSPVTGAAKYDFQLAAAPFAASFRSPIASASVAETGVRPITKLDNDRTYFWRVRVVGGEWSAIANFATEVIPEEPAPPVVVQQVPPPVIQIPPAPAPPPDIIIPPAPAPPAPITPAYIWAIIIIGAILVIAVIVLIVRTRRPV
jgi:hypothetical protein